MDRYRSQVPASPLELLLSVEIGASGFAHIQAEQLLRAFSAGIQHRIENLARNSSLVQNTTSFEHAQRGDVRFVKEAAA